MKLSFILAKGLNKLDKFHMTLEQNIFVAKRNIIDYIWKDANLEGIAIGHYE